MLKQFREFVSEHQLIPTESKTVLAVSGGVDSVVMTDLFSKSNIPVIIAHCNFQLRGEESERDEAFVRSLGEKYGYRVLVKKFDTKQEVARRRDSVQMVARELRFEWFHELLADSGGGVIATGHHLDDKIETFFINLLRGTGMRGLRSIMAKQKQVIHPMLFTSRKQILSYAAENKLKYREDSSNESLKYRRNQVRHQLMPVLEQINPNYQEVFKKNFNHFLDMEALVDSYVIQVMEPVIKTGKERILVDKQALKKHSDFERVFRQWMLKYGFNAAQVASIIGTMEGLPGKMFYSDTHRVVNDRDFLVLQPAKEEAEEQEVVIGETTREVKKPIRLNIHKQPFTSDVVIYADAKTAMLDYDKLQYPLYLRRWKHGDTFIPLGMTGRKKVSDFFIDQKLSVPEKENTWILLSGDEIVWVVGQRIDHRFRITDHTKEIVRIELFGA